MLKSYFLQIEQPLLSISEILLDDALAAEDVTLDLLERHVLSGQLLADNRRLVRQVDIVLLLGSLDDLIHGV